MAITTKNRKQLRSYFVKNAIPTEGNFRDLIDAPLNQAEDGVFRLPGEPLSVVAAAGDQRRALRLYGTYPAANPDWQISLSPAQRPDAPQSARPGLGFGDGAGNTRLFIDAASGNLGVGTNNPADRLTVSGGDLRVEGDGYHRLKVLAVNAGVELVARNPGGTPHIDFTQGILDNPDFGVRLIATDNRVLHVQSGLGPATLRVQGELAVDGGASVGGDLTIGGLQSKLDVREQFQAVIRAADLRFGHTGRRGEPGRALVDGKEALVINFGGDWSRAEIQSPLVVGGQATVHGPTTVHGPLTVGGATTAHGTLAVGGATTAHGTLTVGGATTIVATLAVGGQVDAQGGLSVQGAVAHIEHDGAFYRHSDGQVYLTVDDHLFIRNQGGATWAAHFETIPGNLNLRGRLLAAGLEVRVAGTGGWDRLVVAASDAWNNGNQHVTIGAGAAGIMFHNPHVSWFAGEKRASIRYGLTLPNKTVWDVGAREDDSFSVVHGSGNTFLRVAASGEVGVLGDLVIGGKQNKLDVHEQAVATIRAHDLHFGHSGRRGPPGRALVDGKEALIVNYGGDWSRTEIHSPLTVGGATTIHGPLTVGGVTTIHGPAVVGGDAQVNGGLTVQGAAILGYATHIADLNQPLRSGVYQADNPAGRVPDNAHPWVHLLALRHANSGNHHQLQIAASYAENDKLYFRKIARELGQAVDVPWSEVATVTGGVLRLGGWSLHASGGTLQLRCGDQIVAQFGTGWDKLQIYQNGDGKAPYFYFNGGGHYGK